MCDTRLQFDGSGWICVGRCVSKVCNDGEICCFVIGICGNVVCAWFNIKEIDDLIVVTTSRIDDFISVVVVIVMPIIIVMVIVIVFIIVIRFRVIVVVIIWIYRSLA